MSAAALSATSDKTGRRSSEVAPSPASSAPNSAPQSAEGGNLLGSVPRVPRLAASNAWTRPLSAESLSASSATPAPASAALRSDVVAPNRLVKPPVPQRKTMTPITESKGGSRTGDTKEAVVPIAPMAPKVDVNELDRRAHAAGVWRDSIHPSTLRSISSSSAVESKSSSCAVESKNGSIKSDCKSAAHSDERRNWWLSARRACEDAVLARLRTEGTPALLNRLRAGANRKQERVNQIRQGMKPYYGAGASISTPSVTSCSGKRTRLLIEVRIVNKNDICASAKDGYGLLNRRFITQTDGKRSFSEIRESLGREFQSIADRYCITNQLTGARPRVEVIETQMPLRTDFFFHHKAGSRSMPDTFLDSARAMTPWGHEDSSAPWQLLEAVVRVTDTGICSKARAPVRAHLIRRRAWISKQSTASSEDQSPPARSPNRKPINHDARAVNLFPAASS